MRKGLIALIFNIWLDLMAEKGCAPTAEEMADHLISNGVTVRKHGRWLQEGNAVYMWRHNCSLCGDPVYNKIKPYNYCPNCGAKMDGEENAEK